MYASLFPWRSVSPGWLRIALYQAHYGCLLETMIPCFPAFKTQQCPSSHQGGPFPAAAVSPEADSESADRNIRTSNASPVHFRAASPEKPWPALRQRSSRADHGSRPVAEVVISARFGVARRAECKEPRHGMLIVLARCCLCRMLWVARNTVTGSSCGSHGVASCFCCSFCASCCCCCCCCCCGKYCRCCRCPMQTPGLLGLPCEVRPGSLGCHFGGASWERSKR